MANAGARGRPIKPLVVSAQERAYLERQVRRHRVSRSLSERCRVILRCADGLASKDVAVELGLHEHTVGKWRRRFLQDRCDGLLDEARPGRPRTIADDQVAAVIERTLRTTPADATHWSIRSMAAETGFSHTTIRRMWAAFGLQPHRSQTFKLSSDPLFVGKTYGTDSREGMDLWERMLDVGKALTMPNVGFAEEQEQGAFRISVTDAYNRACAVSGGKVLPALDAAHIKPYTFGGSHNVSNGILLRRDIHSVFDAGYVTIDQSHRFVVSARVKTDFNNGEEYRRLHGARLSLPVHPSNRPDPAALVWHNENIFFE